MAKKRWTPGLLSLEVDAPEVTFVAGQFARLALPAPVSVDAQPAVIASSQASGAASAIAQAPAVATKEHMIGRPYSFVNAPGSAHHEFYFNVVAEGPFSPRLAKLEPGDALWLAPRANGFFSVGETPAADALWCLSTGTGIGPFLSMLRTPDTWERYARIVLVQTLMFALALVFGPRGLLGLRAARSGAAGATS